MDLQLYQRQPWKSLNILEESYLLMEIKKLVNGLAAVGLLGITLSAIPHLSRENVEVNVRDVRDNVVVTDKGEFENTWSAWEGKFSPYELKEGQKYLLGVYGWEGAWPFEWKKNIMYVEELPQEGL